MPQRDFSPFVYTPGGSDDNRNYPPGCLCINLDGVMCALLLRWAYRWNTIIENQKLPAIKKLSRALIPNLLVRTPEMWFGPSYRQSRWPEEFLNPPMISNGDIVYFCPQGLQFTKEQRAEDGGQGMPQVPYVDYDYIALYQQHGLLVGSPYIVEIAYPEPFIKVAGIDIVMSSEVWRRTPLPANLLAQGAPCSLRDIELTEVPTYLDLVENPEQYVKEWKKRRDC